MKLLHEKKGMTLIEIVVAVAILGIIMVCLLTIFGSGFATIFKSGYRTNTTMIVQSIVDDLNVQKFADNVAIKTYLNGKGYNQVLNISNLIVKVSGKDVNYYIGGLETIANTQGYQVTILMFFKNGHDFVKVTSFVIMEGA